MADLARDWKPSDEDLAYWRFLKLTQRPVVGWLCLTEGHAAMWARPRDPLLRHAFRAKHAGHEHIFITEVLDRYLKAKLQK
jgi:hypothetical protein